ncbi:hypothetical protein AB6C54_18450 [Vibrio splendidus]
MSITIHPSNITWDTFGNLETFEPKWLEERDHWENFIEALFHSNGLSYTPSTDSNVEACILSEEKAAFSSMISHLLPRLEECTDLAEINTVLMAHWTPDLHLGTSVVNHVIHTLGLAPDSFGLAISDRGLSAPLFALDCLANYLNTAANPGLLLISDQKNLLYKSDLITSKKPENSACILKVESGGEGWQYQGYRRVDDVTPQELGATIRCIQTELELSPSACIIASDPCLTLLPCFSERIATDEHLLCSAPFVALQSKGRVEHDHLMVIYEDGLLYTAGFKGQEEPCA